MNNDESFGSQITRMVNEQRARSERVVGSFGSVFGGEHARAERSDMLRDAQAALEEAQAAGDEGAVTAIDQWIDQLFEDARAGRLTQPGDRPNVGTPPAPAPRFDGGVRGRRTGFNPNPSGPQTSAELFAAALATSRAERFERAAAVANI